MTGHVDGSVSLEAVTSLNALFELDERYNAEFSQSLKVGYLSELVGIRPDSDLKSSLLINES